MANLRDGCKAAIHAYADQETQNNAVLFNEHRDFVEMVIRLYRDRYKDLEQQGATEWSEDQAIEDYLDSIKPY